MNGMGTRTGDENLSIYATETRKHSKIHDDTLTPAAEAIEISEMS